MKIEVDEKIKRKWEKDSFSAFFRSWIKNHIRLVRVGIETGAQKEINGMKGWDIKMRWEKERDKIFYQKIFNSITTQK